MFKRCRERLHSISSKSGAIKTLLRTAINVLLSWIFGRNKDTRKGANEAIAIN